MRILTYVFETSLDFSEDVSDHSFVLRCLPKTTSTQIVMQAQVYTDPRTTLAEQTDGFGNRIASGYSHYPHGQFNFYANGLVMADPEAARPEAAHPISRTFTNLTRPAEAMGALAMRELAAAGGRDALSTPEGTRVIAQRLCGVVHELFSYEKGETTTRTTALEAFEIGKGVCQDYSHVLISLLRAIGIPARYVTGLLVGVGASHAWVEAHDGVMWWGLDPTHDSIVDDRYLVFCTGRDFEDCPIERGVFRGQATQTQTVSAALSDEASAVELEAAMRRIGTAL